AYTRRREDPSRRGPGRTSANGAAVLRADSQATAATGGIHYKEMIGARRLAGVSLTVVAALGFLVRAQDAQGDAPAIAAVAKGPNQINLTWPALKTEIYGYLVEIRSAHDPRYANWTELQPIPKAGGYTCDSSIVFRGAQCTISDPQGAHVYNPSNN